MVCLRALSAGLTGLITPRGSLLGENVVLNLLGFKCHENISSMVLGIFFSVIFPLTELVPEQTTLVA